MQLKTRNLVDFPRREKRGKRQNCAELERIWNRGYFINQDNVRICNSTTYIASSAAHIDLTGFAEQSHEVNSRFRSLNVVGTKL